MGCRAVSSARCHSRSSAVAGWHTLPPPPPSVPLNVATCVPARRSECARPLQPAACAWFAASDAVRRLPGDRPAPAHGAAATHRVARQTPTHWPPPAPATTPECAPAAHSWAPGRSAHPSPPGSQSPCDQNPQVRGTRGHRRWKHDVGRASRALVTRRGATLARLPHAEAIMPKTGKCLLRQGKTEDRGSDCGEIRGWESDRKNG